MSVDSDGIMISEDGEGIRIEEDQEMTGTCPGRRRVNHLDIITLNVGGMRFQTLRSTLKRFPDSLLGELGIIHM